MKSKHFGLHAPWLVTAGIWAVACSLTVPSEDDVFGQYDANGGGEAGMPSGNGGSDSGGKSGSGGKATSGTGAIDEGGAAGEPAHGGAPTGGTSPVGTAGAGGEPEIVLPPAVLLLHYTFDDADVMNLIARDSTGNGKDGTLTGTAPPAVEEGHIDGALRLDSTKNQYVQLPGDIMAKLPAISVTSWVKLATGTTWDRLFDFNESESVWFYCSLTGWDPDKKSNAVRIAVASPEHLDPELILNKTYPVGAWHHLAVVLAPPYLRYYQDGELLGEVTSMTLKPSDVGTTNKNWLGKSAHPADPYLNGWVDDFRVYSGALTQAEVSELAAE